MYLCCGKEKYYINVAMFHLTLMQNKKNRPGVHIPPTEFLRGDPT